MIKMSLIKEYLKIIDRKMLTKEKKDILINNNIFYLNLL
jgi:hypothetical protein